MGMTILIVSYVCLVAILTKHYVEELREDQKAKYRLGSDGGMRMTSPVMVMASYTPHFLEECAMRKSPRLAEPSDEWVCQFTMAPVT